MNINEIEPTLKATNDRCFSIEQKVKELEDDVRRIKVFLVESRKRSDFESPPPPIGRVWDGLTAYRTALDSVNSPESKLLLGQLDTKFKDLWNYMEERAELSNEQPFNPIRLI